MLASKSDFSYFALPTGQGKTFILGLLNYYFKVTKGQQVTVVVPNEDLKVQMID